MADQTVRSKGEDNGNATKTQELLTRFSSTVFAFDTSPDTRYIRCDFPQCKQHSEALQGKPCWLLNTIKNVKFLERHVGKEVHHYMKERDSGTDDPFSNSHLVDSKDFIERQWLPNGVRKVLAVFNLKDPQSQFGDWISLFLKAALRAEGTHNNDCMVITQNFVSRQELMESIAKLSFLNSHWPTVEVVAVLSCHSSCQGQVFSCTPFAIGKESGFEEFCSLHDFVMASQTVLKDVLMATHISSCFTLKLDCSHVDWPVDADWLKTRLRSILCGSTKEVYETGSQVADLHLMLSTMVCNKTTGTCGTRLKDTVNRACAEGFPDLAREMGLGFLGRDNVEERLSTEGKEDQVTPPGLVMSSMRVIFLVQDDFPSALNQEAYNSKQFGSYIALADAIVANLRMRKASDVKFEDMVFHMKVGEICLIQESLKNYLDHLPNDNLKVIFVAIGPMFSRPNLELIKLIKEWNDLRTGDICYGIHFQHVTAMQAFVMKNKLKEIQENSETTSGNGHLAVTGLIEDDNRADCSASFPVLLYMIHLAIGENGNRLAGKGIPSAVYSKKPVGHGLSSWTLEEVYMETCYVLSGLGRKCGLHLLSAAPKPVESKSTIETFGKATHMTSSGGNKLESVHEKGVSTCLSNSDVQPPARNPEEDSSSHVTLPSIVCTSTTNENACQSFHDNLGNNVPSTLPTTVRKEQGRKMWQCETPTTSSAERTEDKAVHACSSGSNIVTCAKALAEEVFNNSDKSSLENITITEGNELDDVMSQSIPSSASNYLLATYPLGKNSVSSKEKDGNFKTDHDKQRLVEEPCGATCLENSPSIFSLSATVHKEDAGFKEEEAGFKKEEAGFKEEEAGFKEEEAGFKEEEEYSQERSRCVKEADGAPFQQEPFVDGGSDGMSTVSVQRNESEMKPIGDESRLFEEADNGLCHKEKGSMVRKDPCTAVSPNPCVTQEWEGKSLTEEKGEMELTNYEDVLRKDSEGVICCNKLSPAIVPVRADANLGEGSQDAEVTMYRAEDGPRPEHLSSISSFDATNMSTSMVEGTSGETIVDENAPTIPPSSPGKCGADKHAVLEKRKKKKDKKKKNKKKDRIRSAVTVSDTSSCTLPNGVQMKMSFQSWLQNFTDYCKGNHEVECKEVETDDATNVGEKADRKGSCGGKRPLLTDFVCDVPQNLTKRTKSESDSDCKGRRNDERFISCKWDKSDDLPLMANVDEVLVYHYILDLSVEFNEKSMKGNIVLFLEPRNEEVTKKQFQMTLDSTLVSIESVSEVVLPDDFQVTFCGQKQSGLLTPEMSFSEVQLGFLGNIVGDKSHTPLPFKGLSYSVYGWFVQISKPEATGKAWPRCVWIKYHTSPEGSSLTWATDQDGKPSVFSPGAYINNRSLMPCQEPPVAMSTWQASIHVPEGCVVLMSGNQFVGKTTGNGDQVTYHYEMDCPLPCSTLALAVGWWQCRLSRTADTKNGDNPNVPVTCRLFAPPSLIDRAAEELLGYAPKFLEASCELLGPFPFRRLDMLVLPKCFACMGLKSPNLVFLSQSLLSGEASMRVRLAHEISHAWFGLLVGTKDWREEWLSEGFATFVEEKIQSKAERWSRDKDRFFREMRQILRHRCLLSEIKECDDSLKCLRPKVVKPKSAISVAEAVERSSCQPDSSSIKPHTVVQFGQICSKKWTQVHYLKGYFLLHRMANMVGLEEFDQFLFEYVQHFKEQLVTSEDFFGLFMERFPNVPREMKDKLTHEWLESPGLPRSFPKRFDSPDNELVSQVENEFQVWKKQDTINKRNKTLKVRKRKKPPSSNLEVAEQVVLLLEKLLEREAISHNTLRQLDKCYNLSNGNAEIRHRWCELVVKHNYTSGLPDVQKFLVEDQGMGIYLFGELIISQQPRQRALVDDVLAEIGPEMDRCTYQTVKDMLEGND
ncbi:uncharacterized protein LOC111338453 [Stylophora pistillata]|nr:uncharacterized protein LOC111338453 [Stylophora pistillata]